MAMTSTTSLPDATKLAVDRTRLAYERTLMAWVRTATSLISFGFTLHKVFEYLREQPQFAGGRGIGPRGFALIMILVGLIALSIATVEHHRSLRALRAEYGHVVPHSLATLMAGFIALLGIFGLMAVVFRL